MGGAQREGGNTTPTASFNVFCDPHAAHVVLASGIPFVWVNLDVTHKLVMTRARLDAISIIGRPASKAVHDMLTWDHARRLEKYGAGAEGLPVSDLSVIAYLMAPHLFSGRQSERCRRSAVDLCLWHDGCRSMGFERSFRQRAMAAGCRCRWRFPTPGRQPKKRLGSCDRERHNARGAMTRSRPFQAAMVLPIDFAG